MTHIKNSARHKIDTINLKFWICLLLLMALGVHLCFFIFISERGQLSIQNRKRQNGSGSSSVVVNQLTSAKNGTKLKPFKILFWTRWYDLDITNISSLFGDISRPCKDFQPIITFNTDEYASADAIVFNIFDFQKMPHLPPTRNPSVPWILGIQETPINRPWEHGKKYDSIFNYTWSLREESEVHTVIKDMFEPRQVPDEDWIFGSKFSKEFMRRKTGMAAWIATNFYKRWVHSKRLEFARKLQAYGVNVTVFNDRPGIISSFHNLPKLFCPRSETCFRDVGLQYKFYFAFENSLCANSMYEKVARGIVHGMVPVFYGFFNLSANAPPHSYIDAMEFNSTEELAKYLIYLDKHDEEYFKYFEWRQNYSTNLHESFKWLFHCPIWSKIRKLKEGNHRNSYSDLERWFHKFDRSGDGSYCDVCLKEKDIDEDYPKATRDRLYRGKNCVKYNNNNDNEYM